MSTAAPKPTQADLLNWLTDQMVKLQLEEPTSPLKSERGKDIDSKPESNVQAYPLKSDSDTHSTPHKVDEGIVASPAKIDSDTHSTPHKVIDDIVASPAKIDSGSHSTPHKVVDADIGSTLRKRGLTEADIEALKRVLEQLKDSTVEERADAAHAAKVDCYGW